MIMGFATFYMNIKPQTKVKTSFNNLDQYNIYHISTEEDDIMGSMITLGIGRMEIDWGKNSSYIDYSALF